MGAGNAGLRIFLRIEKNPRAAGRAAGCSRVGSFSELSVSVITDTQQVIGTAVI